jgi:hypothetical protein
MYGNELVLLFIGLIIGAIVVFFICRELICWYYKINRIVSLLEAQYRLLAIQMTFVPTHTIKSLIGGNEISLRTSYEAEDIVEKLPIGTKVQFLENSSKNVELNGIKGTWVKIITQEKIDGWCFSGNLEKM